jgi:hypothetical protein
MIVNKPKPGEEVCDFCGAPKPVWAFPCRNHVTTDTVGGLSASQGSLGAWGACDECHALILKADREGVVRRAVENIPAELKLVPMALVQSSIRHVQDNFWSNRDGDPIRTDSLSTGELELLRSGGFPGGSKIETDPEEGPK